MSRSLIDWRPRWWGGREAAAHLHWDESGWWSLSPVGRDGVFWPRMDDALAAHAGRRVWLSLGASVVHSLLLPPELPLAEEAQQLDYARLQFQHYFGSEAIHWPMTQASASGRVVACALHAAGASGWQGIAQAARTRQVSLLGVRPLWALALRYAAQQNHEAVLTDSLWVVEGPWLTRLQLSAAQLQGLQQRFIGEQGLSDGAGAAGQGDRGRWIGWHPEGQAQTTVVSGMTSGLVAKAPSGMRWLEEVLN